MNSEIYELEMLRLLADMPFLDRLGMARVSGRSRSVAYDAVDRLEWAGLVASAPRHGTDAANPPLLPHRRRGD